MLKKEQKKDKLALFRTTFSILKKTMSAISSEINSPGGAPVASYELASAIKKINKTTIAVIREVGASGAFWAATAANKIYANQMSLTGSIGVLASHLEFAGIMQKYNVTYRGLVAGKYKDAGTPYKQMTTDEQAIYQKILDKLHEQFINAVAQNRKMSFEQVRAVRSEEHTSELQSQFHLLF